MSGPRIVSLLPSTTEIVAALDRMGDMVGRSHECDYPAGLDSIPAVTRARINPAKPSKALHKDVVKLIEQSLSVFEVDAERLRALKPDIILTQHQCAACAVTEADLAAALAEWTGAKPTIVSVAPATLKAVWRSFGEIGTALGIGWAGRELAAHAEERVSIIAERAAGLEKHPSVACVEWLAPPMIAGNWIPELVEAAGGKPVLASAGAHSDFTTLAAIAEANADAMILMPCGFDLKRTLEEGTDFIARPTIAATRAVKDGAVWAVDANAYFNRPGPRLVDSIEILAEILHPGAFNFTREGTAWAAISHDTP